MREFVGHGIGASLHEEPQIANYGEPGHGPRLAEGMVLAIEPMVNMGKPAVRVLSDGWTAVTRDGSLSAHFEHTVAVTKDGPLVLTERSDGAGWRAVMVVPASDGRARGRWRRTMPVSVEGTVLEALPHGLFRVGIERQREVVAHVPSGPGGTSSACWSAIACGWNCRRGI